MAIRAPDGANKNKDNKIKENQQAEHDLQARGQLEEPHTPKVSESHLKERNTTSKVICRK